MKHRHGTTLSSTTLHRAQRAREFWSRGTAVCGVILQGTSDNPNILGQQSSTGLTAEAPRTSPFMLICNVLNKHIYCQTPFDFFQVFLGAHMGMIAEHSPILLVIYVKTSGRISDWRRKRQTSGRIAECSSTIIPGNHLIMTADPTIITKVRQTKSLKKNCGQFR